MSQEAEHFSVVVPAGLTDQAAIEAFESFQESWHMGRPRPDAEFNTIPEPTRRAWRAAAGAAVATTIKRLLADGWLVRPPAPTGEAP